MFLFPSILDFITRVSSHLPQDVKNALQQAQGSETGSSARIALDIIQKNVGKAEKEKVPLCQDTGFPTFWVTASSRMDNEFVTDQIHKAVSMATKKGILRPNAVDSLTGENSGNNLGDGFPKIIFDQDNTLEKNSVKIQLLLKGGGCENTSAQMALPAQTDFGRANRDIEGVEKAVLQMVKNAEGKGCAPGIVGVHIGGDRSTGYEKSKKNLFRECGNPSENNILSELETRILQKANHLNIGPMGFGGKNTLLDCFCSASHRLPASFFVTVSYNCWALRRGEIVLDLVSGKEIESATDLFHSSPLHPGGQAPEGEGTMEGSLENAKKISLPLNNSDIDSLKTGDTVLLSGVLYTGRDRLHHSVVEEGVLLPEDIAGSAIYHCGPIMKKNEEEEWQCVSAGPTTSIREEPYQAEFIEKTGVKAVIGKGNMGEKTLEALRKHKAVYLHAIGGAAAVYAECVEKVEDVFFLEEFGMPESLWKLRVKDFPVVVTMK